MMNNLTSKSAHRHKRLRNNAIRIADYKRLTKFALATGPIFLLVPLSTYIIFEIAKSWLPRIQVNRQNTIQAEFPALNAMPETFDDSSTPPISVASNGVSEVNEVPRYPIGMTANELPPRVSPRGSEGSTTVTVLIGTQFVTGTVPKANLGGYSHKWRVGDHVVVTAERRIRDKQSTRTLAIVPTNTSGIVIGAANSEVRVRFNLAPILEANVLPWQVRTADGNDEFLPGDKARICTSEYVFLTNENGTSVAKLTDGQVVTISNAVP